MLKLSENYEGDRRILKCDYIRYSPVETSTINTLNSQVSIKIPREDPPLFLLNIYCELNFQVNIRADYSRYGDGNDIKLISLGPVALFSNFKATTSSGKHLEVISHCHIVFLM